MKFTNASLPKSQKELLKTLINQTIIEFVHDEYEDSSNPYSYMTVWFITCDNIFEIHYESQPLNYFGEIDDVAVVSIKKVEREEVKSSLVGHKLVHDTINKQLINIALVEDTQIFVENGVNKQAYTFVSALIFDFKTTKLMLTFDGGFSEMIDIYRGPHAEKYLPAPIDDIPEEERARFQATREIYNLLLR